MHQSRTGLRTLDLSPMFAQILKILKMGREIISNHHETDYVKLKKIFLKKNNWDSLEWPNG